MVTPVGIRVKLPHVLLWDLIRVFNPIGYLWIKVQPKISCVHPDVKCYTQIKNGGCNKFLNTKAKFFFRPLDIPP